MTHILLVVVIVLQIGLIGLLVDFARQVAPIVSRLKEMFPPVPKEKERTR